MESPIFSCRMDDIRPIMWYGREVYTQYEQIHALVASRLGADVAALFTKPVVSDEAARTGGKSVWLSASLVNPVPLTSLAEAERAPYEATLASLLDSIVSLSRELRESDDRDRRQIGEVLQLAVEVPGLAWVMVEKGRIALACWGFHASTPEQARFRLIKALNRPAAPASDAKAITPEPPSPSPSVSLPPPRRRVWALGAGALALACIVTVAVFLVWSASPPMLPTHPGLSPANPDFIARDAQDPLGRRVVTNRLLVTLKDGVEPAAFMQRLQKPLAGHGGRFVGYRPEIGVVQVECAADAIGTAVKGLFQADPDVEGVSPEAVTGSPAAGAAPTGLKNWGLDFIGAPAAWRRTTGAKTTLIAIVDLGFAATHPDLAGGTQYTYRSVTGTAALGNADAGRGHGTHVAGIAGAMLDKAAGIGGVCLDCGLMLVDVADDHGNMSSSAIMDGVESAIRRGARVINLSLGTDFGNKFAGLSMPELLAKVPEVVAATRAEGIMWERLYRRAESANTLLVTAAGNENIPMELDPMKRSTLPLYVGALAPDGSRASFSNFGPGVTVSAPGVDIVSTLPAAGFGSMSGTSMAAPFVTGAAGLIVSLAPTLKPADLRRLLRDTGRPVGVGRDGPSVGPAINIASALAQVAGPSPSPEPLPSGPSVRCDCDEAMRRISDLERRVAELERTAKDRAGAPPPQEKLTLPDQPTQDLTFAEGLWRASKNLVRRRDRQTIQLVFDIRRDGSGRITYEEPEGTCSASLTLTFNNQELLLLQQTDAPCTDRHSSYERYQFACVADGHRSAKCTARDLGGTNVGLVDFFMERER